MLFLTIVALLCVCILFSTAVVIAAIRLTELKSDEMAPVWIVVFIHSFAMSFLTFYSVALAAFSATQVCGIYEYIRNWGS